VRSISTNLYIYGPWPREGAQLPRRKRFVWKQGGHGSIAARPRRTESIPNDWDIVLLNAVVGRIQPPMTGQLLGRKLTVIVDGRDDVVEGCEGGGGVDLPFYNSDGGVNYGSGFKKIKIVLLVRNGNLQQTDPLSNIYAEERD
jgi:hypothetical protein